MAKITDILKQWISWNRSFIQTKKQDRIIHGKLDFNTEHLYQNVLKNSEPIFVLSTGRCGTALLTKLLAHNDSLDVKHEPSPSLIYHSKKAYENSSNIELLSHWFDIARYELIRDSFLLGKRYIETNNRVTFFATGIAALYPKAKFVHIERDLNEFVTSGISRNWYSYNKMADEGRITSSSGNFSWSELSQVEKITWLWLETNRFIRSFTVVHPERCHYINSADLFKNDSKIEEMLNFLNIDGINRKVIRQKISHKVNKQASSKKKTLSEDDLKAIQLFLENYS